MIELGKYNKLTILRESDYGLFLDGGPDAGDILLPNAFVTKDMKIGQELEVFLYLDQQERLTATTEKPVATVGQFAHLEVAWINKYGAFLSWGLQKDLFCPFREQKQRMTMGHSYIVYVTEDHETHRLMATAKVERYLVACTAEDLRHLKHGTEVDILVWQKTDLGFKVIVGNRFQGQLYDNQIFRPLTTGDRLTAYVDHIRQDGKIDLTLQATGHAHSLDFADTLLQHLRDNGGYCPLGDKSPAEDIYALFAVSKKTYKKAIGDLYRRRLITIAEDGALRLN